MKVFRLLTSIGLAIFWLLLSLYCTRLFAFADTISDSRGEIDPPTRSITEFAWNGGDDRKSPLARPQLIPVRQTINPISNTHTAPATSTVSITYNESISPATVTTQTFAVHAMQTGLLTGTYSVEGGQIMVAPNQPFKPGELVQVSATTGTLNLSGQEPISPTVWQFRSEVGGGSGIFSDSLQNLGYSDSIDVEVGDLDGDADLDIFLANLNAPDGQPDEIWLNDGSGKFIDSNQNLGSSRSYSVALGDLDGDGDLDAFVVNYYGDSHRIWLNDGTSTFFDSGQNITNFPQIKNATGVELGDLDSDGDLDAAISNFGNTSDGDPTEVWLNNGNGIFTDSTQRLGSAKSRDLALGDADNDGDLDIFVTNANASDKIWLNNGIGVFFDSNQDLHGLNSNRLALGDFDRDADLDIFLAVEGAGERVWLNNGQGIFVDSGQTLGESTSTSVGPGDFDRDGDLDVFVTNTQGNRLWLNDGTGLFSDSLQYLGDLWTRDVAPGDFDGDGDLDVALGSPNNQANTVWINRNYADLQLEKLVTPLRVTPGSLITYSLLFYNNGPESATDVQITDNVALVLNDISYIFSNFLITSTNNGTYTWQTNILPAGATGIITITGRVAGDVPPRSIITNTATITASSVDTDTSDNTGEVFVTVEAPALVATKQVAPAGAVRPGDRLTYTLRITNTGNGAASAANLTDPIPINATYVPASANVSSGTVNDSNGIQWNGNIPAGESINVVFQIQVDDGLSDGIAITNTATISDSLLVAPVLATATTIVDSLAPTGAITIAGGATYAASTGVLLTLSAQDTTSGVSEMQFSNDGLSWSDWQNYLSVAIWSLASSDGEKTVYSRFKDRAGNISTVYSDTIILDTIPPTGTINIEGNAEFALSTVVTLSLSATDANGLSQMQFSNGGAGWSSWEPYTPSKGWLLSSGDGSKTVFVRYQDNAGNTADFHDTTMLDTLPPTSTVTPLPVYQTATAFDVSWSGTDAGSELANYDVQVKAGTGVIWTDWLTETASASAMFTGSDGVTYYFQTRARDSLNHLEAYPGGNGDAQTTIDISPPAGSITINLGPDTGQGAVDTTSSQVTLILSASDATSGLDQMAFSNDGLIFGSWQDMASRIGWTLSGGDGPKTVFVKYRDRVSNEATYSDSIVLNTGLPGDNGVCINNCSPATASPDVTLTLKASAHTTEMKISNSSSFIGASWEPYAATKAWRLNCIAGSCSVYVKFKDVNGVESQTFSSSINYQTGLPILTISKTGPITATAGELIGFTLTVSNNGAIAANNLEIIDTIPGGASYVSGGSRVGNEVRWNFTTLPPADQVSVQFSITATDNIVNNDYRVTANGGVTAIGSEPVLVTVLPVFNVTGTGPPGNGRVISAGGIITATFNRALDQSSVNGNSFTVRGNQSGNYGGAYSFGSIQFQPAAGFKPGEQIVVNATQGIKAPDGVTLTPFVWQFRAPVARQGGHFTDSGQRLGGSSSFDVALGDLDGDGDLDAFIANAGVLGPSSGQANRVWFNEAGTFTDSGQLLGSKASTSVALGDVDNDGDLDACVGNYAQANEIWLNDDGHGTFINDGAPGHNLGNDSHTYGVALGDLDGDGDLDMFEANWNGEPDKVWLNNGLGHFYSDNAAGHNLGNFNSFDIALGDLDNDGDLDALVVNEGQPKKLWRNDGQANFSLGQSLPGFTASRAVALGDVDDDGDLDALVANSLELGKPNELWLNNGGSFSLSQSMGQSNSWSVSLGDLDGDGDLDALFGNLEADEIWLNNGIGQFSKSDQILSGAVTYATFLGDVDSDGDLDAFIGNGYNQANEIWLNGGLSGSGPGPNKVYLPLILIPDPDTPAPPVQLYINSINTGGINWVEIREPGSNALLLRCTDIGNNVNGYACGTFEPIGSYSIVARTNNCGTLQATFHDATGGPVTRSVYCN